MMKFLLNSILLTIILISGCVHPKLKLPENKAVPFQQYNSVAIREKIIMDFLYVENGLNSIVDQEINIVLTEPILFSSLFQLLTMQGVNVMGKFNDEMVSVPSYRGSVKKFLKGLQTSYGLFFVYENNILIIRDKAPVFIKVLMPSAKEGLIDLVKAFGIEKPYYDSLSSRIVFQSDYYSYQKIRKYFLNNPYLTQVTIDIMILENEEHDTYKAGIDWQQLSTTISDLSSFGVGAEIKGNGEDGYSLEFNGSKISMAGIYDNLRKIDNFRVVQSARLSTLSGSESVLNVSESVPYVSEINISSLSSDNDTIVQGFEFAQVESGLKITLQPLVSDNIVTLEFDSQIQNIVDFLEVGSDSQQVQQPIVSVRNLNNKLVLRPGEVYLIGGLRYTKGSLSDKSLTFFEGVKHNETRMFSISIMVRCEIVKYVFMEGVAND